MIELKNEKVAVPVVLFAGLIWSFGPLVVRYMNDPHLVPWQYIFGRGLTHRVEVFRKLHQDVQQHCDWGAFASPWPR